MSRFILYAVPMSLYSAKARSYMLKQHVDFVELSPGATRFTEKVMPETGRLIVPVMETPDGQIVQDGVDIIDWFETNTAPRQSAYPADPVLRVLGHIFELFGGEGLVRLAMHYRWNFNETNKAFLEDQFATFILPALKGPEKMDFARALTDRMRFAGAGFGVQPEVAPAIEEGYTAFLDELEAHMRDHPYLFGGLPTIADYGMIAPLYPHLGRDPYPAQMMKDRARAVFNWVERMNQPGPAMPEFPDRAEALIESDDLPDTLITLLKRIGTDYGPEVESFIAFTNQWLEDNEVAEGDLVGGEDQNRVIGNCEFDIRGTPYKAWVMPYRIFVLQRAQDAYDALTGADKDRMDTLLSQTGLTGFITSRSSRRVERANNRDIWGAAR